MTKPVALILTHDELDELLSILTAACHVAGRAGKTELLKHAEAMIFNLADSRFDRRHAALEMKRAITEREGRPYFDHQLEKVKELLEMNDGTT